MRKHIKYILAAFALAVTLVGCGSEVELLSVASSVVENQRTSTLTATSVSGVWKGYVESRTGVPGKRVLYFVFSQPSSGTLDGSLMIEERIEVTGATVRDTFLLSNSLFGDFELRFNLRTKKDNAVVTNQGSPVNFSGALTENTFMSGSFNSGNLYLGYWEAMSQSSITAN